jgi:hypothetical protein
MRMESYYMTIGLLLWPICLSSIFLLVLQNVNGRLGFGILNMLLLLIQSQISLLCGLLSFICTNLIGLNIY